MAACPPDSRQQVPEGIDGLAIGANLKSREKDAPRWRVAVGELA
jgi:hypothetical protein